MVVLWRPKWTPEDQGVGNMGDEHLTTRFSLFGLAMSQAWQALMHCQS